MVDIMKYENYVQLFPLSDVHLGALNHDGKLLSHWIRLVNESEFKRIYLLGDLIDYPTTRIGWDSDCMSINEAIDSIIEVLNPLKDDIIISCRGNHEKRSSRYAKFDVSKEISKILNVSYSQNDYFDTFMVGDKWWNVYMKHGTRYSKSNDLAMRGFKQDMNNIDADICMQGHNHYCSFDSEIIRLNNFDTMNKYYCFTGNFYQYHDSYAHDKGGVVMPTCFPVITIFDDGSVDFEKVSI